MLIWVLVQFQFVRHVFLFELMAEQQAQKAEAGFKPQDPFLQRLASVFGIKTKPGLEKMTKTIL